MKKRKPIALVGVSYSVDGNIDQQKRSLFRLSSFFRRSNLILAEFDRKRVERSKIRVKFHGRFAKRLLDIFLKQLCDRAASSARGVYSSVSGLRFAQLIEIG